MTRARSLASELEELANMPADELAGHIQQASEDLETIEVLQNYLDAAEAMFEARDRLTPEAKAALADAAKMSGKNLDAIYAAIQRKAALARESIALIRRGEL